MAIVTRAGKGSELTHNELDENFNWLNAEKAAQTGVTDGSSATTGKVGEYIESAVGLTNFPASAIWGDLTSITLTAGDWDVGMQISAAINTATGMAWWSGGIGSAPGNTATGLTGGDTQVITRVPTASEDASGSVSPKRYNLASSATLYVKYGATYSGGVPHANCRISARRVR